MTVQRLRIEFTKGERVRYISHLDVLRHWERAIRRAGLPLAYSKGFTPHPKITFAAPLPLGFAAEAEVMDILLDVRRSLGEVEDALATETTGEMALQTIREVPLSAPALQSALRWADYRIVVPGLDLEDARATAAEFLRAASFPWTETKKDRQRDYDLRQGVASLELSPGCEGGVSIRCRLSATQDFTVRPEQLLEALFPGAEVALFVREGVVLDEPSPAREAWRRRGQYLDEKR